MDPTVGKVSRELQAVARDLDRTLERIAGERVAFQLIVCTGLRPSYVGNASREDAATAMRALLKQWDDGLPDVPAHTLD